VASGALVACGLASACSQYNTNLTIQTSTSSVAFLSPSTAIAGGSGFTITVNGAGFVTGAIILWNVGPGQKQTQLVTTLVSSVQLTASVLLFDHQHRYSSSCRPDPGSAVSERRIPARIRQKSNVVFFRLQRPGTRPTVTSISASTTSQPHAYCSAAGITLTVNGTNFVNDSTVNGLAVSHSMVYWNGAARPTTFVSTSQLTALIPATDTAFPVQLRFLFSIGRKFFAGNFKQLAFTMVTPRLRFLRPACRHFHRPPRR